MKRACAWLAVGCLLASGADQAISQDPPPAEKARALPEGLRHVPHDALGFVHVRVGAFLGSDLGKSLLDQLRNDKEAGKALREFDKKTGLALADVESVTIIFPQWQPPHAKAGPLFMSPDRHFDFFDKRLDDPSVPNKAFEIPKGATENKFDFHKPKENGDLKREEKKEPSQEFPRESPVFFQEGPQEFDRFMGHGHEHGPRDYSPLLVITSSKPINRRNFLKAGLFADPRGDDHHHDFPLGLGHDGSMVFVSDRSVLVGTPWSLVRYVDRINQPARKEAKPEPLAAVLNQDVGEHLVVAGGHLPAGLRKFLLQAHHFHSPRELAALYPLLSVTSARLALDLGKNVELTVTLHSANERGAALAAQSVKTGLVVMDLGLEALADIRKALGDPNTKRKPGPDMTGPFRKALAAATVEHKGAVVVCRLQMPVDPALFQHFAGEIVAQFRGMGDRAISSNNLKQIALAMHNYHSAHNGFPPSGLAGIQNRDGKPLLSWRVAILPYIEQEPLYRQFNLDLPWDHPHNKKLIAQMPKIYAAPGITAKEPGLTNYQVFTGPGTVFEQRPGPIRPANIRIQDIQDGTSNTLMVVEAAKAVIWTKPEDIVYDPKQPLPRLGGVYEDGFHAAFCDGSVRFLRKLAEETLRALITRNGNEVVDMDR